MKRISALQLLVALFLLPASAQLPKRLQWGDQQNGTYMNPVLNADFSDPDVIRVDGNYYMVASDFHFMGMQVLESADLLHWRIVSQVFDRIDLPGWDANQHYGGGSWAPAIRHHNGLFYLYFCTPDEGLFMSTAADARGPWSPLHCVKAVEKWEDPCPFWDDDGQAYLGRSQYGAGPIIIHKMSEDGHHLLDDGVTVYTGPVAEGTKFLKRDGYYYIIIPEGGVCCGWQTVLRSRGIYGPYEKRVVLEQGSTTVNGPHQGALVEAADSTWWFVHFQETHPGGRVVHLQPARWTADGWPSVGVDIDGNGIGEPVAVWTRPTGSDYQSHLGLQDMSPNGFSSPVSPLSDDFSADSLWWVGQHQRALGPQWQWNHNPVDLAWNLSERRGWLTLNALPASTLKMSHNMLTQKTVGYESEATTRVDGSLLRDDDYAGLLCMGNRFMAVGICRQGGQLSFYVENDGVRTVIQSCRRSIAYLRVHVDSQRNQHQFFISSDGRRYIPVGEPFSLRMGSWKGSRVGLFCYHAGDSDGGKAQFDFFYYNLLR